MVEAIVRDVNCVGAYPSDRAQRFSKKFPDNELYFKTLFDQGEVVPAQLVSFDRGANMSPRFVFNLPTRIHWRGQVELVTIKQCIEALFNEAVRLSIDVIKVEKFEECEIAWEDIKTEFLVSFSRIPDIDIQFVDSERDPKAVSIFTDGGAAPNQGKGGYGVVLRFGDSYKELSAGFEATTNNRMELLAAVVGLESLTEPCKVRLHSDSRYVVDPVTRGTLFRWQSKDWNNGNIKNLDLWQRFLKAYLKHQVKMVWVKGHAGVADNVRCDQLATEAMAVDKLLVDEGFSDETETVKVSKKSAKKPKAPKPKAAGDPCPNCKMLLMRRETSTINPNSAYYYPWQLYCQKCRRVYHVKSARVPREKAE